MMIFGSGVNYQVPLDPYASYVTMLLKGEGESIVDEKEAVFTTYGVNPPTISTVQKKFNNSSILLNPNSYMETPDSDGLTIGSGDYTTDFWIYNNSIPEYSSQCIMYQGDTGGSPSQISHLVFLLDNKINWWPDYQNYNSHLQLNSSYALPASWTHIALIKYGSNFSMYVNGTVDLTSSRSVTINDSSQTLKIGSMGGLEWSSNFYLDHFRLTKGIARWTGDFTPPGKNSYRLV